MVRSGHSGCPSANAEDTPSRATPGARQPGARQPGAAVKLMLAVLVVLGGSATNAETRPEFVPATFGKYEARFVRSIRFPKEPGPVDVRLLCDATLYNDGRGRGLFCEGKQAHPIFHEAATRNDARYLRLVIPRKDGRKKTARFQFNIHFVRDAAGERISVQPNHRHNLDRYGEAYSSPQRYEGAYRASTKCDRLFDVRIRGVVPVDGRGAQDVTVVAAEANESCVAAIRKYFARSSYIPGFADGEPAEMVLIERFWRAAAKR